MQKIYEIQGVDFFREDIFNTNPVKDAEDLSIWFSKFDSGTSFIQAELLNKNLNAMDLTNIDVTLNWQLTNREKRLQEEGIEKIGDGKILITVPSAVINSNKGKCYFTITLQNRDTLETLTSAAFLVTIVDSLASAEIVNDELLYTVKNAEKFDNKTYVEVVEDVAGRVETISKEGLATEQYVDNAVANKVTSEDMTNAINEATKDFTTNQTVEQKIEESKKGIATEQYVDNAINNIPDVDLTGYVKNNELAEVAKSGDYNSLINKPILDLNEEVIEIENYEAGQYNLKGAKYIQFNNNKIEINDKGQLFIFEKDNIKSFILVTDNLIVYNVENEIKMLNLNNIVSKNDIANLTSKDYVDSLAVQTKSEVLREVDEDNIVFRDAIYQTIIDTFAKVPATYLIDYATKDYVVTEIAKIDVSSAGITEDEVNKLIDAKLAEIGNVDLSNYYTKNEIDNRNYATMQEVEAKQYLTKIEGDELYMPYRNEIIDDVKPKIGEYKTVLKGDFFNKYHEITDFWNTNNTNNHEMRRVIRYIHKIFGTDRYIAFIDNNGSEHEKGFSIFHFVTNKSIEEDAYITMSSLNLTIADNTYNRRVLFAEDKALFTVVYYNSAKEARAALLSINTANWTINVDDEVVIKDASFGYWLCQTFNDYSNDIAVTDNFDRIAMLFNKTNDTTALNLVIYDIEENGEGKYKFINKKEFATYNSEFNAFFNSNIAFLDKNHFTAGIWNNNNIVIFEIDETTNTLSYTKMADASASCLIKKIDNYLFLFTTSYNKNQSCVEAYKINSDFTLSKVDTLNNNSTNTNNNPYLKYAPVAATNVGSSLERNPAFICNAYYVLDNKITILYTGVDYDVFSMNYAGSVVFNTVTDKFEYYYPNFSYVKRQLTGIVVDDNKAIGYIKNKIYLFEITKDECLVCQCGNNILYSYVENMRVEEEQNQPIV